MTKLSPKERHALAEFAKPRGRRAWSSMHGRTIHALERKGLIGIAIDHVRTITPAGEAELRIPNIFDDLFEKAAMKPTSPDALTVTPGREVTYHETSPIDARKSAEKLKGFVDRAKDQRRDIAIANAVLDVLRDSSLSEDEAIALSKRVVAVIGILP